MSSSAPSSPPRTFIVGVGLTKFHRPSPTVAEYDVLAAEAINSALSDATLTYSQVEAAIASYVNGDSTAGQRAIYQVGLTAIPIINVNNNCSSGSTALYMARMMVLTQMYDCVLAVGFEKMQKGNLTQAYLSTHASPTEKHFDAMFAQGVSDKKLNPQMNDFTENVLKLFAAAQEEHMKKYGTTDEHFITLAHKAHKMSVNNPYAVMSRELSIDEIKKAPIIAAGPIRASMACPVACGAAATIICSERFIRKHNLQHKAVEILSQALVTDIPSSFNTGILNLTGYPLAKLAAEKVFTAAQVKPGDVDVVECHDCFSCNELFMYEALGLCPEGEGKTMVEQAQWIKNKAGADIFTLPILNADKTKNKKVVVNPSGGLQSKGHPIGCSGLGQACELVWQLRGQANKRQVDGARVGLQHNFGIGSAAVVTLYRKPEFTPTSKL